MPCYRPTHLSTHQQVLVEQGDPNPSKKQKHSGQQDVLVPVTLLPPDVWQRCLQVSVGEGLGLVGPALMQT